MYVIMYHFVRCIANSKYPNIKGLEILDFKKQIEWFISKGFKFITLDDVIAKKNITSKSILLTFDDGYRDHYENVYPLLCQYGIKGVFSVPGRAIRENIILDVNKIHFILAVANIKALMQKLFDKMDYYRGEEFVYASNEELYNNIKVINRFDEKDTAFIKRMLQVELPFRVRTRIVDELFCEMVTDNQEEFAKYLYMNMDEIEEMKRNGMEFAIHGYDHCWLNRMTDKELVEDLEQALDVFDGIINSDKWCICYPYGAYSDSVIQISRKMGAILGLGTEVRAYHSSDNMFKIPRTDTNDFPPKSYNYKKIV